MSQMRRSAATAKGRAWNGVGGAATRFLGILDSLRLEQLQLEVRCQSDAMPLFLLARPGLRKASKSVEHDRNMGGDSVSGRKIVWMV